jgi:subtilase family serine protease
MTPENAGYYYAAYIAAGVIYIVYAISIGVRRRRR